MKICAIIEIDSEDPRLSLPARDESGGASAVQVVRDLVLSETDGVRAVLAVMPAAVALDMMATYRRVLEVGGLATFERMAYRPGEADPAEAKP